MTELQEIFDRIWTNIVERPSGPFAFRFYLQPAVAVLLAVRDGLKDARDGTSPYFWAVLSNPAERGERLREGLRATAKVLIVAAVLDVIYQLLVLEAFYPLETLIVAFSLAFLPYLLVRGPVDRVASWWKRRSRPRTNQSR